MEESTVEIIRLPVSDWAAYREVRLAALREEPAAFSALHEDNLAHPDSFWQNRLAGAAEGHSWLLFARCEGRLVGMIGAFPTEEDPTTAAVIAVYVAGAYRGRGIGDRLMTSILEALKAASFRRAILGVNASGIAAVHLYLKHGFTITGEEAGQMGDGQVHNGYWMEKVLGE